MISIRSGAGSYAIHDTLPSVADYSHPLEVRYHWLSPLTRNSVTDAERCHANGRYALSHLMNMLLKYDFVGDAE